MPKPQRFCVFCGRPGLSKEHIFSEWTHKLIPKRPGYSGTIRTRRDPVRIFEHSIERRQGDANTVRPRIVCRLHCNSGWMQKMEDAVIPILTPLMMGKPSSLDKEAQHTLATWITMKLMVAEYFYPDDIVTPQAEREFVMNNKSPPSTWQLWITRCRAPEWRTRVRRHAANVNYANVPLPEIPVGARYILKNTQLSALGFGELYVLAYSTTSGLRYNPPAVSKLFLNRLWPFEGQIKWPPEHIIAGDTALTLSNGIEGLLSNPDVIWVQHPAHK